MSITLDLPEELVREISAEAEMTGERESDPQSGRADMAAKLNQQISALANGFNKIEIRHAAGRTP